MIKPETLRKHWDYAQTLSSRSIRIFEIFASLLAIVDLWAQWYYLRGTAIPPTPLFFPVFATALGIFVLCLHSHSKFPVVAILMCHYFCVITNSRTLSAADAWLWLMGICFLGIPGIKVADVPIRSLWCFALKTTGFWVYFFAGLHKVVNPGWFTGATLSHILTDADLAIPPFDALANWPVLCQVFSWITLLQRLVVPWGLWFQNAKVRRSSILILGSMHIVYILSLRVGTFSWVGLIYLTLFWSTPQAVAKRKEAIIAKTLASAFLVYTFAFPALYWINTIEGEAPVFLMQHSIPGFTIWWGMFADYRFPRMRQNIWAFGETKDYFRRRLIAMGPAPEVQRLTMPTPPPIPVPLHIIPH